MALPTRLRTAVVSRSESPKTCAPWASEDTISAPRDPATSLDCSIASAAAAPTSTSSGSCRVLAISRRERSTISWTRRVSRVLSTCIRWAKRATASGSSLASRTASARRASPPTGVLSSWLTLTTKSRRTSSTRRASVRSSTSRSTWAPLGGAHVLLLVDDRTEARRVEDVRRDFVVNVSHELKTPVGGLALLAEAVLEANDDPEAVARFAHRMQVESTRLTRLVQEIVDLSRLEIASTLHDPELVDVGAAAAEAIEQSRLVAGSRGAEIVSSLAQGAQVFGDSDLLTTAVRNLVGNAINYSAPGSRVAVSVRAADQLVEIAVADQGQGIPDSEQARIFERFYRVDAARSRATGGTGLGLAIVQHICACLLYTSDAADE